MTATEIQGIRRVGKTSAGEYFLLDLTILLTRVVHKNGITLQKGEGKQGSRSQCEMQYSHSKQKLFINILKEIKDRVW